MKKYKVLMLLGVMFLLPIVLAKLMLTQQWYSGGVTNKGQLLTPPLTANWLASGKWQLIYWLPQQCDSRCEGALFHLKQMPLAVGAYQDRVRSVVLLSPEETTAVVPVDVENLQRYRSNTAEYEQFVPSQYGLNAVYLADPHGNVMMAYPLEAEPQAILAQGKDILRDLKRLLKVSKIG
ncbi:cytochrome oxidase [Photobacterium angustum]|uniref:Cytochrome oxidase n=1 Tax=Photobacterium angustum TaxID=661 RepID=A0A2S7W1F1_PHOAN|nr:cytochrome oxidase [Photobacterium angustum]PQJ68176.1 cytochrome oxidase [Photobacterium angustum]